MKVELIESDYRCQHTLSKSGSLSSIGIHSGQMVQLHFSPLPPNSGIVFRRKDLGLGQDMPAMLSHVSNTERSTSLASGEAEVQTVEHLLAAVYALQIDNMLVEVDHGEVPGMDGSSLPFFEALCGLGRAEQKVEKKLLQIKEPVFWSEGEVHLVALPSSRYHISYTLDYPNVPIMSAQYASFQVDEETFAKDIAPCRTFALLKEVEFLRSAGLIKGGSLENGVVVEDDRVVNPEGLRFKNEMARHKLLDLIGDLSLLGCDIQAHILAVRSGHASNVALAKQISNSIKVENHHG